MRRTHFLPLITTLLSISTAHASEAIVVDGDTLNLDGTTYRLHGIDSPEPGQKCNGAKRPWPCGKRATDRLVKLTAGRDVQCDNHGAVDYDRIIAVCQADDIELNDTIVREGHAWAFTRFSTDYVEAESEPRAACTGIWQAPTETAWEYRARLWDEEAKVAPEGCPIKGNISKHGMIYHDPWSPWYSRTKISVNKGERWFAQSARRWTPDGGLRFGGDSYR